MSASAFTATSVAPIFLTRPFVYLDIPPSTISSVNNILQRVLEATGGDLQTLYLCPGVVPSLHEIVCKCSPETLSLIKVLFGAIPNGHVPPSSSSSRRVPIALALVCHYFGLQWDDWFLALGGTPFKLVLRPTTVYVVRESDEYIGVVWVDHIIRRPTFTQISSTASELSDSDDADDNSSRPSSRLSTFSFSSRSSASSNSSIVSSSPFPSKHKSSFLATSQPIPAVPAAKTPTQSSFISASTRHTRLTPPLAPSLNDSMLHSTPRPFKPLTPKPTASPLNSKTKYLYQGGMSTVLTGGVMLGRLSLPTSNVRKLPPQSPRYTSPNGRSPARDQPSSWRG